MPTPVGLNVWSRLLVVNFADVPRPEGTLLFATAVVPHL